MELILSVWPWSPGILSWRYGALGIMSRALLTPLVGLAMIFATAVVLQHRWVLRGVLWLGVIGSVGIVGAAGLFALDFVQLRSQVNEQAVVAFEMAGVVALLKLFAIALVLLAFGVGARQALKKNAPVARPERSSAEGVLFGSEPSR